MTRPIEGSDRHMTMIRSAPAAAPVRHPALVHRALAHLALALFVIALLSPEIARAQSATAGGPLTEIEGSDFYQRVLTLPGAELHRSPDTATTIGRRPPVFSVYYVYGHSQVRGQNWVEVADNIYGDGRAWLPAELTVPWSTMLVMEYAPVGQRGPLLFFDESEAVDAVLQARNRERIVNNLIEAARQGRGEDGVLSFEETGGVVGGARATEAGYLMPVLNFQRSNQLGVRLLKVASLNRDAGPPPSPPSVKTCDGTLIPTRDERAALRHIRTGIVFVVDTTISMGPYIERLREAVQIAHDELKAAGLLDRTSFGLIAYRNDMSREPQKSQLEYVTRVFQPLTCGAEPGRLLDRMGAVKPARVSTRSFSEDAIAGLYEALGGQNADLGPAERMVWEDADARFIFLITDAGALPAGDPQSKYPGVDLAAIHADATGKDVTIFPIHLISKEAQARNNVGPATEQYRLLAMDQGQTNNYKSVAADDVEMYDKIIREAIGEVITTVKKWERGEKLTQLSVPLNPDPETQPIGDLIVNKMFNVQQRFLGRVQGGRAPQFFEAWAADQDLANPDRMALRASVFLTRNQLSALGQRLEAVLRDAKAAYTDQRTAFQDMQSVTAITAVDPNLDTRSIDSQDKLQAFLERLPYKTRLLTMRPKDWRTLGALRQLTLIGDIEYKLNAYRELSASDCWIDMTPRIPGQTSRRGDPGLEVCAVSLERLP
jgi:serine/threonine-protein kinase PpkA